MPASKDRYRLVKIENVYDSGSSIPALYVNCRFESMDYATPSEQKIIIIRRLIGDVKEAQFLHDSMMGKEIFIFDSTNAIDASAPFVTERTMVLNGPENVELNRNQANLHENFVKQEMRKEAKRSEAAITEMVFNPGGAFAPSTVLPPEHHACRSTVVLPAGASLKTISAPIMVNGLIASAGNTSQPYVGEIFAVAGKDNFLAGQVCVVGQLLQWSVSGNWDFVEVADGATMHVSDDLLGDELSFSKNSFYVWDAIAQIWKEATSRQFVTLFDDEIEEPEIEKKNLEEEPQSFETLEALRDWLR